ncbi:MAG TPA: lipopolysaccharide assembly protein LapA domain-containing protein [Ktedonobacteraceae bacterium]|nr:lipopolysaccharide assembly protein LapA domain-containing protein [Ktedonobacteraceae bacterium]
MLYIVIILFLLFSGVLAVVAFENFTTQVQISLFAWQSPDLPLGLLLLLVFVLGAVLLYLVSAASAWQDWHELRRLRQRIGELEIAMNQQPTVPTPQGVQEAQVLQGTPEVQGTQPIQPMQPVQPPQSPPIVPMPGMPTKPDISDMPTQH